VKPWKIPVFPVVKIKRRVKMEKKNEKDGKKKVVTAVIVIIVIVGLFVIANFLVANFNFVEMLKKLHGG
jgi:Na+-transporting methylmalonyl-CoA/oxaloacetate decarboxylase beta subunit